MIHRTYQMCSKVWLHCMTHILQQECRDILTFFINIQNGGTIMIKVNAIGDACPIPVVKTKNAIRELQGGGTVETLVDNEIAVQNLTKMANQKRIRCTF